MKKIRELLQSTAFLMFASPVVFMIGINFGLSDWLKDVPKITYPQALLICLTFLMLVKMGQAKLSDNQD
ncbi:MAG: hypothetical protein FWF51_11110 [Chitinivibrionia bacterium]|nr:hypothetical protein [Chitinivibrionia bacterium]